jgi:hypothetical protein
MSVPVPGLNARDGVAMLGDTRDLAYDQHLLLIATLWRSPRYDDGVIHEGGCRLNKVRLIQKGPLCPACDRL